MPERRAPRLFLEVAFLAALAAALTFADLQTYQIVGVMVAGWLLVALFEWGAFRARPHFGSGSPPRWYTPRVTLPPPRPLEQVSSGYPAPEAAADAPTWIAPPSLLAEWPVADTDERVEAPLEEQTQVHDVVEAEVVEAEVVEAEVAVAAETEHVLPPEPEEDEPERAAPEKPTPKPRPKRAPRTITREPSTRRARHRIDPLGVQAPKGRRFGRRSGEPSGDAEVPDGPPQTRLLPAQARDED